MHIGIDLGGTNIAAALVDDEGAIKERVSIPTNAKGGLDAVVGGLFSVCEILTHAREIPLLSIGIGVPGAVNDKTGDVIFTANLPITGVNLSHDLQKHFGCPVRLGNDANCAALGEATTGAAKNTQISVFVTLGTGVGGGIIIDGKLFTGFGGAAGELGHVVTEQDGRECGCGRRGCWETYSSATGLIKTATELMYEHRYSMMWELAYGKIELVNGRAVFDAYRADDAAAKLAVGRYLKHLAVGFVNIINTFEPEVISVGGGISNSWDVIDEPLNALVDAEKFSRHGNEDEQTRIVRATLGNEAGIIGAAMLR
jgi:glucokinase